MKTPTNKEIARYARAAARKAISVRRVDPVLADQIVAEATAECERMYAAQRAA